MARFRYSRWDGTQVGFDFDADDAFRQITDDLLYHGDLNAALRRLLHQGFRDNAGREVAGLRELLERLRERRQDLLRQHDLGGAYEDIAERLRQVVDQERDGIDRHVADARASGDERRADLAADTAAERRMALDLLPPDLAGQVRALQQYEWTSREAEAQFESLLEELRREVLDSTFNQMAGALGDLSPEALQRTKDFFNELNQLLEQRRRGEDTQPGFEDLMERFGDLVPGQPANLDELLEAMARQMAAMSSLLASMTPEQRAQLQALSDALLEDMDLRWQMERLAGNLREAFPDAGWGTGYSFSGQDPLNLPQAADLLSQLGDLDQLEQMLAGAPNPGALAEVDIERARQLLGEQSAASLEALARLTRQLREAGLVEQREGRLELTSRGLRRIGQQALADLFSRLSKDRLGRHLLDRSGVGHERAEETKPYEYGDPFNLSIERTLRRAVARQGAGTPVRLDPEDFEVERTEASTRSSTVVMLDLSLSMPMRDNFLAAKKVAMAMQALISGQYPGDYLGLVGFSRSAREISARDLPEVSWDYEWGTNIQHGLLLARQMLARHRGSKQIVLITDGEPTAHWEPGAAEPTFAYPPIQETVDATLLEVARCTREHIRINTFVLDATGALRHFVEELTRLNQGRAFFTTPDTLGDYVLVDFLDRKRSEHRRRRPA